MFAFRLMRYVDLYTTQLDNLIDVPLAHKYFPAVYSFVYSLHQIENVPAS